jgi:uncharacterized protein (TIGR03067 family)
MAHDVFISYSSKDKMWADAACAVLEKRRIRCWVAPRDITPGTEWGAAIIEGMDASKIMVLIFSTHANESAQVRREVERAISKGLVVLPFRIENISPAGAMEYALSNTHWLDGFTKPIERQFDLLARSVESLLSRGHEEVAERGAPPILIWLRLYGRQASTVVVAALALVGFVALIAMLRGGSGQPQPIARTAPGPDQRRAQTQPRVSTAPGFDPRHGQSVPKVSTPSGPDRGRGQLQKKAETVYLSDEDRFRGRWEQVGTLETNKAPAAIVAAADIAEQTIKKRDGTRRSELPERNAPPAGHHIANTVWVFRASNLTLQGVVGRQNKTLFRGSYLLQTAGTRNLIDLSGVDQNGGPLEWRGIYEFDGDFVKICWRDRDDAIDSLTDRPSSFAVGPDNRASYVKLRRAGRG